jgi:hypothetical protein
MEPLLPSSFAPVKRQRKSAVDENANAMDKFVSPVAMNEEPSVKRVRPSPAPGKSAAPACTEVVSVIFVVGSRDFTRKDDAGDETTKREPYVLVSMTARPPLRGSYVRLVSSEKKLAVELVESYCSSGVSLNEAIKQVKSKCTLFSTLSKSAFKRFKAELESTAADSSDAPADGAAAPLKASGKRAGRPSTVPDECRDAIKEKVSCHAACTCHGSQLSPALLPNLNMRTLTHAVSRVQHALQYVHVMQVLAMSQKGVPMDAVHAVALAHIKQHAPAIQDTGFKACDTWCQKVLFELNLVRRKVTTAAAKLPADWELRKQRLACQVCLSLRRD